MTYDAFLSYSQRADGRLAPALQSALERFARPWYQRRRMRVFRDATDLTMHAALMHALHARLADTRFLVLLASPEAAQSPWVQGELEHWLASKPIEQVLVVVTSGELAWDAKTRDFDWASTTALPRALAGRYVEMPRYVDLRWARGAETLERADPRFTDVVADIACRVLELPRADLIGEDARQHRRFRQVRAAATSALALLTVAAVALGLVANHARGVAEDRYQTALGVIGDMSMIVEQELLPIAAAASARRSIVSQLDRRLAELGPDAATEPKLRGHRLAVAIQAGDVALAGGEAARARSEFERALAIARELAGDAPEKFSYALQGSLDGLGRASLALGDLAAAHDCFVAALGVAESSARAGEREVAALGVAHANLADVLRRRGLTTEAAAHVDAAIASERAAFDARPDELRRRFSLAQSLVARARIQRDERDVREALALTLPYAACCEDAERLRILVDAVVAQVTLNKTEARASCASVRAAGGRLAHGTLQERVLWASFRVGCAVLEPVDAVELRGAVTDFEALATREPLDAVALENLGIGHAELFKSTMELDKRGACDHFTLALQRLRQATALAPGALSARAQLDFFCGQAALFSAYCERPLPECAPP